MTARSRMAGMYGLWAYALDLLGGGSGSVELVASAALAAAGLFAVAIAAHVAAGSLARASRPAPSRAVAVRARIRDRRLPRLSDPDAAGRPRSRAPAAYPSAA